MNSRWLLYLGRLVPIVFFGTTIVCGYMQGNYNHFSRMVSELGTIGTRSQFVFMAGLLICSGLSVLFVFGLLRRCKESGLSVSPVFLILTYSFSIAGAALFPLPLRMHGILGSPSILLILSPLLALMFWRKNGPRHIIAISIISLLVMALGFLAFMPDFLAEYMGLKQRFFHVGWSIWFVYLSFGFSNLVALKNGDRPLLEHAPTSVVKFANGSWRLMLSGWCGFWESTPDRVPVISCRSGQRRSSLYPYFVDPKKCKPRIESSPEHS